MDKTITPNKKHPGGRPTIYGEDIITKTKAYIDSCEDEQYQLIKTDGDKSTTWENKVRVNLPSIEGLALELGINRETIYAWEKEKLEFSNILGKLREKQAKMLIKNGLSGDYNPTIAKLLLAKHGYRETIDTDVTSKGEKIEMNSIVFTNFKDGTEGK